MMVSGLDFETSNDDLARHISLHEPEFPFYDFPYNVKLFLKDL